MKKIILFLTLISILSGSATARADSYWKTGGIAGGVSLGLTGLALTGIGCGLAEANGSNANCAPAMVIGTVGAGAVGFGIGALIGSAFKKKDFGVSVSVDPINNNYGAALQKSF